MKMHTILVACVGLLCAATLAHAQTAPTPVDTVTDLQNEFGKIVGDAFHRPDPIVAAINTPGSPAPAAGQALRTSLEAPGAVWAGLMKPFADMDPMDTPVPAASAPKDPRRARIRHHRVASQS